MRLFLLAFAGLFVFACGQSADDPGSAAQDICCGCDPTMKIAVGGTSSSSTGGVPQIDCKYSYSKCTDGYTYGFHCTGPKGNYTCDCLFNGPAVKQFSSATMCDFDNGKARVEALNAACGFHLSTSSRGSGVTSSN